MQLFQNFQQIRHNIGAADVADPTTTSANGVFQGHSHDRVRFALNATGAVTVTPCWYDSVSKVWYQDTTNQKVYAAAGKYIFDAPCLGEYGFLYVNSIAGSQTVTVYVGLTKVQY